MNAAEFLFAFATVFGSTAVILAWNVMVYSWEKNLKEGEDARNLDILS